MCGILSFEYSRFRKVQAVVWRGKVDGDHFCLGWTVVKRRRKELLSSSRESITQTCKRGLGLETSRTIMKSSANVAAGAILVCNGVLIVTV